MEAGADSAVSREAVVVVAAAAATEPASADDDAAVSSSRLRPAESMLPALLEALRCCWPPDELAIKGGCNGAQATAPMSACA